MNQAEASGSDDDMESEEQAIDALAAAVLESEGIPKGGFETSANALRAEAIAAEVARRRNANDAASTRRKSDAIFEHFDRDQDGYLNFKELRALGQATGGDLPHAAFASICEEIGANPSHGVTKALLLTMYTDAGLGDAHRDYNLIFRSNDDTT